MQRISQEVTDLVNRGMDRHLKLAVTGLSRAGKTAFITSLVNQLLYTSTHDSLPLLQVSADDRLIGAKREPQTNLLVPRFSYDEALEYLSAEPPQWPKPTKDVSEIRLAIKYKPSSGVLKYFTQTATLYLDIVDYPGEWLLDLPLLEMDFEQWSQTQLDSLKGKRLELAKPWLDAMQDFELGADVDEKRLAEISELYTDYLHACKDAGLHWVQPGRFVLPGDLAGAPVLQFFPVKALPEETQSKTNQYAMLKARYEEYQNKVVKKFYKEHFSTFDRQIVLVDCLQPLNAGQESFGDMQTAIEQLLKSFKYGRSNLLSRLLAPKIDKVLFAATKADHVTPDQHANLVSLLKQMVHPAWRHAAYENIDMSCMSLASITATEAGYVASNGGNQAAIQGVTEQGQSMTLYPGEVPASLPDAKYWQQAGFDFQTFLPKPMALNQPCGHIRLDKALEFLVGDKLQ
ncbi:YcjX family protein [Vibrio sp. SCSIO 43136]|uniref:YcjX family protein n=1 Tax=Vibrio sp. SCSIO 43136 TaxID=2819101 RepID=UPI00207642A8|nr:YcjX family protein [Vibrio sp. SCSIO 43136]USD66440.1 YcjX family protein [Vibrio sp. SCSIO 43136]